MRFGTYPTMEHSLVSFLERGVMIQYQNLTFELVYRYSGQLVFVDLPVKDLLTPRWRFVRFLDYHHSFAN